MRLGQRPSADGDEWRRRYRPTLPVKVSLLVPTTVLWRSAVVNAALMQARAASCPMGQDDQIKRPSAMLIALMTAMGAHAQGARQPHDARRFRSRVAEAIAYQSGEGLPKDPQRAMALNRASTSSSRAAVYTRLNVREWPRHRAAHTTPARLA